MLDDIKNTVSEKWSEFTDEIWGPSTSLGQMMEVSTAINTQMESLGNFKLSKREIAFGLYLDAHNVQASRRANPAFDAEAHKDAVRPPLFLIETLLWYVGTQASHCSRCGTIEEFCRFCGLGLWSRLQPI